jgi:pterin-4a-carbinolamine dehydratase
MNTQTAVETKTTQYPSTGNGGVPGNSGEPKPQPPEEAVARLKSERIQEELKALTGWDAVQGETAIECVKTFATPQLAGLYGGFVAQSAAATGHPVTVNLSGGQVCVTVYTPNIDGCPAELDLSVLAFARQL